MKLRAALSFFLLFLSVIAVTGWAQVTRAQTRVGLSRAEPHSPVLSPIWGDNIRQWSNHIGVVSQRYGLDPDFIAAVIKEESNGTHDSVSWAGAVGLMGVMPMGPGFEWRPSADELRNPAVNLGWGAAILTEIIQQSGGDLYTALAAYSGGWPLVESRIPRLYATNVLDNYGRAVAARNGISPEIATRWTLAIELRRGHVARDMLLVLGQQPVSGLHTYGEHVVYRAVNREEGNAFMVKGYAVPVALVVPAEDGIMTFGQDDALEVPLQARMGEVGAKVGKGQPHVLLACLPSLGRLRGRVSTRWFAPSNCPSWHR